MVQSSQALPHSADRIEGESSGPNYAAPPPEKSTCGRPLSFPMECFPGSLVEVQLNGVEMEFLPCTPMAAAASGVMDADHRPPMTAEAAPQVFYQGAWRPNRDSWTMSEGPDPDAGSTRCVEMRTTVTRQQLVGLRGPAGGVLVQHEQLQPSTSQPASPHYHQPQMNGGPVEGPFRPRCQANHGWQAPLLHGNPTAAGGRDADSSGSIPRELVQEEVRRQVHHALENKRRTMEEPRLENQRLKMEATRSQQHREQTMERHAAATTKQSPYSFRRSWCIVSAGPGSFRRSRCTSWQSPYSFGRSRGGALRSWKPSQSEGPAGFFDQTHRPWC